MYLLLRPLTNFQSLFGLVLNVMCLSACFHLASCSCFMLLFMSVFSCRIWARVLGVVGSVRRWFLFLMSVFVCLLNVGL